MNNHRELIEEEPLYQRIKDILNDDFLHIEELVDRLNDQSANKILEKEVIIELYDYSRLFYYFDGLVVSVNNESFNSINQCIGNVENLLSQNRHQYDEGQIILYLFFFKRFLDLNRKSDFIKNLDVDNVFDYFRNNLLEINAKYVFKFDLVNKCLSYVKNIPVEIFVKIVSMLDACNTSKYNSQLYGKIFLKLVKDISYKQGKLRTVFYSNYSLHRLMNKLLNIENESEVFDPFGGSGGLLIESVRTNHAITYLDQHLETTHIAYMNFMLLNSKKGISVFCCNAFNVYNNGKSYDYILTEPPFNLKIKGKDDTLNTILKQEGIISSKNQYFYFYCFILILSKLKKKAIILVPQSVLNGNDYNELIQYLLENDYLETIIDLPLNIIPNASVKTSLILLNKNKEIGDKGRVNFINASLVLEHHKRHDESLIDVQKVLLAYRSRTDNVEKVEYKQIIENNYILNRHLYTQDMRDKIALLESDKAYYLKDVLDIKSGVVISESKKKIYTVIGRTVNSFGIPSVTVKNLKKSIVDIFLEVNSLEKVDGSDFNLSNIISEECILITRVGNTLSPTIFKPTQKEPSIIVSSNIFILMVKDNLLIEYLYYQLYEELEDLILITSGSVTHQISLTKVRLEKILLKKITLNEQREYVERYRSKIIEKELKKLENKLSLIGYENSLKPLIITEGKTDKKILEIAWKKLYENTIQPFDIQSSGVEIDEDKREGSADSVKRTIELMSGTFDESRVLIGLFDNDVEGNNNFKGLTKKAFEKYEVSSQQRKHLRKNIHALLLPVPNFRKVFVSEDDIAQRMFVIEHYFSDEILKQYQMKGKSIFGSSVFKVNNGKDKFSKAIGNLDKKEFEHFKLLFDVIKKIVNA